ncbi:rCG38538 [Rattus norvegicus]|uniref:RCG38538 n=1 Tax=Rattus norvegicus TaxID=10116 RepID=A6KLV5_RAT|nr:rCG38538 [Rattus norvegicus]
MNHFHSVQCRD